MIQDRRYLEQYYTIKERTDALEIWSKVKQGEHLLPNTTIDAADSDRVSEITYMVCCNLS